MTKPALRVSHWMCIVVVCGTVGTAPSVRSAPPDEVALRASIAGHLATEAKPSPGTVAAKAEAERWLQLSTDRLTWKNGRIEWLVQPQRGLTPQEKIEATRALRSLLESVLAEPRENAAALMTAAESQEAARLADLGLLEPRTRRSALTLTTKEVSDALDRHLQRLLKQGDRRLTELLKKGEVLKSKRRFFFNSDWVIVERGQIAWPFESKLDIQPRLPLGPPANANPARFERFAEEYNAAIRRETERIRNDVGSNMRELLIEALSHQGDEPRTAALLDPQDARFITVVPVPFWKNVDLMRAAPAGLFGLQPTVNRGAIDRRIATLRNIGVLETREIGLQPPERGEQLDESAFMGPMPASRPILAFDPGGFVGGVINSLSFSPDGRWIAVSGDVVRIWDLETGKLLHTLRPVLTDRGVGSATDVKFTPDGRYLLVSTRPFRDSIRVYDTADFSVTQDLLSGHRGHVERLAISQDGRWLATVGSDQRLHLWNWPSRQRVRTYALPYPVDYLGFPDSNDAAFVVFVNGDAAHAPASNSGGATNNTYRLLDQRNWPDGSQPHPFALDLRPDLKLTLAGSIKSLGRDSSYYCAAFRGNSAEPTAKPYGHRYFVIACALSHDGKWAASADGRGEVHVWSVDTGARRHVLRADSSDIFNVSWDDAQRSARIRFGTVRRDLDEWTWNRYSRLNHELDLRNRVLHEISPVEPPPALDRFEGRSVKANYQGGFFSSVLIDREQKDRVQILSDPTARVQPKSYTFLQARPTDDTLLAIGWEDGVVVCYDADSGMSRRSMVGHKDRVWGIAESPDQTRLLTGGFDGTMRLWSLQGFRHIPSIAAYLDANHTVYQIIKGTDTARRLNVGDRVAAIDGMPLASFLEQALDRRGGGPENLMVSVGEKQSERKIASSNMGDVVRPLVSIAVNRAGDRWIAWTEKGYYVASPGGDELVGWHVNHGIDKEPTFHPLSVYRAAFHRPDVVLRTLELGDESLAIKELVQPSTGEVIGPPQVAPERDTFAFNRREDKKPLPPPTVEFIRPEDRLETSQTEIEIEVEVTTFRPNATPELFFAVGDVPIIPKDVGRAERNSLRYRRKLPLREGDNPISVHAKVGDVIGPKAQRLVVCRPPKPSPRRLFVVSLYCQRFQEGVGELPLTLNDSRDFIEACAAQKASGLYDEVMPAIVLDNENMSKDKLNKAIGELSKQMTSNDTLFLHISTHGELDAQGNFYLMTHDSTVDEIVVTGIPYSEFGRLRGAVRGRVVIFVDTCRAAALVGHGPMDREKVLDRNLGFVYCACGATDIALATTETSPRNSPFTAALLDVMRGVDPESQQFPQNGERTMDLTASELGGRIRRAYDRRLLNESKRPVFAWEKPWNVEETNLLRVSSR